MRKILAFLMICVVSGCAANGSNTPEPATQTQIADDAQALWNHPLPLPAMFEGIYGTISNGTSPVRWVCVDLKEFLIWEPGDYGSDTYLSVQRTVHIEVDGLSQSNLEVSDVATLLERFDANGKVIGSHGGGIGICFSVADFTGGLHLGTIAFKSTSGKETTYHWVFKIIRSQVVTAIEVPQTLKPPY